ncbi:MAG: hypothetical protein IPO63_13130 [Bacteroidetes bacterium]|nr:hypothetical protein [Bacteroidota bacterium]
MRHGLSGMYNRKWSNEYFFGCGNNTGSVLKPFIFVEGFDPGTTTLSEDPLRGQYGDFGWKVFSTGVDPDEDDPLPVRLIPDLIKKLNKDGFDIILVDHKNGADFIQANGLLLVSLIKKIKLELIINNSKSEIVVAGGSMGGLVSKYALGYMESNPEVNDVTMVRHNVRLFISFDSPQNGANIPIGDQLLVGFMKIMEDVKRKIKLANETLEKPATKQLVLYQRGSTVNHVPGQHVLRIYLFNDPNFHYPTLARKVAFMNAMLLVLCKLEHKIIHYLNIK